MPPASYAARLLGKLEARAATVAVVGLGHVGLPLAAGIAEAGFPVVGVDVAEDVVCALRSGRSPVGEVPSERIAPLVRSGRLVATTSFADAAAADVALVAVPTDVDERRMPRLEHMRSACAALAGGLAPGSLVVLESTTYPGTTEDLVAPAFRGRGLTPGEDVFIGYSPERIDPGNSRWGLRNTAKVVSGLTPECLRLTAAFYGCFVDETVPVRDPRTAEMVKLFENVFRFVNIALVNELQVLCEGFELDVWEVIAACATKPYGFMPFAPGPGAGGPCVPVDPLYLAHAASRRELSTEFIDLAARVNAAAPRRVLDRISRMLDERRRPLRGAHVCLLGVAYKANLSDTRESPALRLAHDLGEAGAVVTYHDPHVPALGAGGRVLRSRPLEPAYLAEQDCVVVLTDHDAIDWDLVHAHADRVVDTRNALRRCRPRTSLA